MKKIYWILTLVSASLRAQEIPLSGNYLSATNQEILRHVWTASWISPPSASLTDYGVFLLRNKINLPDIPEHLLVYVSGDNRYKLFVNGHPVSQGPARGDELHWSYETVDLAPFLQRGENTVSAILINFGGNRPVAQHSFQTAFLLQSADSSYHSLNTGSEGWRIIENKAYRPIPVTYQMVNGYYSAGPGDQVDARYYPWGWQMNAYHDEAWEKPFVSNIAVGRGYIYGNALHLVPRQIPAMEQKPERFARVAWSDFPDGRKSAFIMGEPTTIQPGSTVRILLDLGHLTIGYPQLTLSGGLGSSVKIMFAEALHDSNGIKGNRNDIAGKKLEGYYDLYFPDGGSDRSFETLWLRTFRYVQIDITTGKEPLVIRDFQNLFTAFPFSCKAGFDADLPRLPLIWEVAWRTARLCAGETYFDCPYYEQLQYIGDTRIQALISLAIAGDDRLMRNALLQFDRSRIPDGITLSRYPSNLRQMIPPYSLIWINMIYDYHLYRNDPVFLKQFAHGIEEVLRWFSSRIDSTGLVTDLEWWSFADYTPPYGLGIPDGADDGYSALINLQFIYSLQQASRLFTAWGQPGQAETYAELAQRIQLSVMKHCFDKTRGLIAETPQKKLFSQHSTIFGILTNTIPPEDQRSELIKVMADTKAVKPSFYFQFYLARALQQTGLGDRYVQTLATFYQMLDEGLTTFAEMPDNPRSDCHAWSASPLFDFMTLIAGIQPAAAGFREVTIAPNLGPLTRIDASYPHPAGTISLHLVKKDARRLEGWIILPDNIKGRFVYGDKIVQLKSGKQEIHISY